jgi:8-oxo-dGTP pyrophosphatase MutT (NUDIX family)
MEEKLKVFNGKHITAACVLINPNGDILGCHATGRPKDRGWDFPKGLVGEDESDIFAAMRELQEETDIWLYDPKGLWNKSYNMIDCGIHPHNKEKNIHIFIYPTFWFPEIKQLKCNSFFELKGKQYPEVDDYRIIKKDERHLFNKVLQDKFEIIDKFNTDVL